MALDQAASKAWLTRLGLTSVAACVAEAATYPIDAVKTQLQLQGRACELGTTTTRGTSGELHVQRFSAAAVQLPQRRLGALATAQRLVATQGVTGLYAGLPPALLRHVFYTGTRISVYERLRDWYGQHSGPTRDSSRGGSSSSSKPGRGSGSSSQGDADVSGRGGSGAAAAGIGLGPKLLMGLTAGGLGQLVAVPADLIKVQLQADARAVMAGRQAGRRYPSSAAALRAVLAANGWRGLWKGGGPAVQRAALVNLGELATYDSAKQSLLSRGLVEDGLSAHVAASMCSGLVAALVSTPADVVKTRLMAQEAVGTQHVGPAAGGAGGGSSTSGASGGVGGGGGGSGGSSGAGQPAASGMGRAYRGAVDCLVQTVRSEGPLALYRGFLPTWARLGPWQLVFWVSYEQLRAASRLGSF